MKLIGSLQVFTNFLRIYFVAASRRNVTLVFRNLPAQFEEYRQSEPNPGWQRFSGLRFVLRKLFPFLCQQHRVQLNSGW